MTMDFIDIIVDSGNECYIKSTKHIRTVLLAGLIIYSCFGFLDWFMLPETYHIAWLVRYCIIDPITFFLFLLTYSKWFHKHGKTGLTILILLSQLGIICMIYCAKPTEGGYWSYYIGLLMVTFWGALIFRLSIPKIILISVTNVLFYNALAIGFQKLYAFPTNSIEFGYLINNNYFLLSFSILAIYGAFQLNTYKNNIRIHNQLLNAEKRELHLAKAKAEESDNLKSAFLANMSHEIRTPMNAILGFTELLKDQELSEDRRNTYIDIVQLKGNQLLRLISDIIDLSKIEANHITLNPEQIQLNALFDELMLTYQGMLINLEKVDTIKLIFQVAFPDENSFVFADPIRLKQILSNLLDNAIKFTSKGEIRVGYKLLDKNTLQFFVKDTGIGISLENQELIFDRFRQVNSSESNHFGGTGLGLSIVKKLVALIDGKIWVESQLNAGSSFYFTHPYTPIENDNVGIGNVSVNG